MKHQKKHLFDAPKNIKRILRLLYACCILLLVLDLIIDRHITHSWENLWGFYPIFGFVSCVILVLVATRMRTFLMRDEDYYSDEGTNDKAIISSAFQSGEANKGKDSISQKSKTEKGDCDVDD